MKMDEIIQELIKHSDEYFTESYEQVLTGVEPVKKHKKARIQKKWKKRYGVKPVYETKKCKKLDVTYQTIIDFCAKYGFPIPEEMQNIIIKE